MTKNTPTTSDPKFDSTFDRITRTIEEINNLFNKKTKVKKIKKKKRVNKNTTK